MRVRTIATIVTGILISAAVAVAARSNVYLTLDGAAVTVLWNSDESCLFIDIRHIGHEVNILRFPWFYEYVPPGSAPSMYTPLENRIYANYPGLGGLCWWAGDHFEPATPGEQQRLDGIGHLTGQDIPQGVNGWFKRSFQVGPGDIDDAFTIEVGGKFKLTASDRGGKNGDRILSINLLRPGHHPEKVWDADLLLGTR